MGDETGSECVETNWNPITGSADELFRVTLHQERLEEPLKWEKPRLVFVSSMVDLFHDDVPDEFIDQVFAVMALCPSQHIFLILTKRPERMYDYITKTHTSNLILQHWKPERGEGTWPLPNVWLGVTAEDQQRADERIPLLLQTPAAVRFVSCEPLLGPIDLCNVQADPWTRLNALEGCGINLRALAQSIPNVTCSQLDWVIIGGETGSNARPCHPDWVRSLRDQCVAAGVPFFFKSWGEWREACPPEDEIWNSCPPALRQEHDTWFVRLGKKASGALLDGQEWRQIPEVIRRTYHG